jgi:hypothetical protein
MGNINTHPVSTVNVSVDPIDLPKMKPMEPQGVIYSSTLSEPDDITEQDKLELYNKLKETYDTLEQTIKNYLLYNNSHNKNNIILADLQKKIKLQQDELKSTNENKEKLKTYIEFIKNDIIKKDKEKIILIISIVILIISIIIATIILLKLNNIDLVLIIKDNFTKLVLIIKNYRNHSP